MVIAFIITIGGLLHQRQLIPLRRRLPPPQLLMLGPPQVINANFTLHKDPDQVIAEIVVREIQQNAAVSSTVTVRRRFGYPQAIPGPQVRSRIPRPTFVARPTRWPTPRIIAQPQSFNWPSQIPAQNRPIRCPNPSFPARLIRRMPLAAPATPIHDQNEDVQRGIKRRSIVNCIFDSTITNDNDI